MDTLTSHGPAPSNSAGEGLAGGEGDPIPLGPWTSFLTSDRPHCFSKCLAGHPERLTYPPFVVLIRPVVWY